MTAVHLVTISPEAIPTQSLSIEQWAMIPIFVPRVFDFEVGSTLLPSRRSIPSSTLQWGRREVESSPWAQALTCDQSFPGSAINVEEESLPCVKQKRLGMLLDVWCSA